MRDKERSWYITGLVTMLIVLATLIGFMLFSTPNVETDVEEQPSIEVETHTYEGHDYKMFKSEGTVVGIVHDPDCEINDMSIDYE